MTSSEYENASSIEAHNNQKSVEELAREVIKGRWGNGVQRKQKLQAAGYDYVAVQNAVNRLLKR